MRGRVGPVVLAGMLVGISTIMLAEPAAAKPPPIKSEATPAPLGEGVKEEWDPLEPMNRGIFWFNDRLLDRFVLKPVARGWNWLLPDPVQRSVRRFFVNTRLPLVALHDLLQAKPKAAAVDVGRFGVNTTVGLVGFLDPATHWGLTEHDEDCGQTFGRWGIPGGPYLVIPFFGSTNLRDGTGILVDGTWVWFTPVGIIAGARVLEAVNERSLVLREVEEARAASLDFYVAVRNAYAQRRYRQIHDSSETTVNYGDELYFPPEE